MAPSRKKGKSSAATAAAARRQWKIGDLVLAKVKGFPAWPATVSEPEKWGYSTDWKKVLVYFFGTNQIAFCNPVDVEAFTEEKKEALLVKRQGRGADFVRAVQEIIKSYDKLKEQNPGDNCISENDVISTPAGNSGCSLVRCRLNDQIEADATVPNSQLDPSSSNIVRSEPGSLVEGYAAAVLPDSSHDKDVLSDEPTRDDVREKVLPSIPSRRRIGGIQSQGIVARRSNQSVRRSRTSSRADSCIFRNHAVQSNDAGKSSGAGVASLVHDGSLRRSRRIRRSPNTSRRNGMRSPDLISNGSIVDNSSEIATMDSDAPGLNGGNTLESGCNAEDADPIQCLEGEVELGKRLELQINTVFVKKKRKPNRKRGFNGTPEFTIEADRSGGLDSQIHGTRETSADTSNKLNERCSKDGGDEHLPLLKRARVRMGKQSAVSEEPSSIKQLDESSSKEAPVKPSGRNCISLNGSPTDDFSEVKSSSRSCLNTCTEDGPYHSKVMSQLCNSVDGEAVLPPSKRLHRALEAMSANAIVDGEICVEAPLIRRTSTIEDCSQISTEGHVGGPCSIEETACCSGCNASKEEHSFEFCATVNPQNSEKNKCRVCAGIINQQDGNAETARYFETVESVVTTEKSKLSLLNLEGGNSPRNNRGSFNKLSCENEMRQRSEYLSAHGAGNRDEVLLKLTGEIPDSALATNETVVFSPRVGTAEPPLNEAENNCEENESARLHQDTSCCSQIDSVFCVVAEETKQVPSQVLKASPVQVAQHSVHSVSTSDEHPGGKVVAGSPSPADEENSLDHLSIVDDRNRVQDNGRCSPDAHLQRGKLSTGLDKDGRHDAVTQHPTSTNKRSNQVEGNAALRSFEGMLGTLTRMKESIGRATRVAIDCAKFGLASKVVDILARSLESEESLYRRVDLFFLVDSITQCSRSLRGDARGTYPTAVQALLPRLLSAAAPPGSAAQENRRQCLKVLRLWLERKILPEPVVRHHMRCLDSHGSSSSSGAFSRRSSRTERAFDDPIRGMEGMLVDEYGSNSSFQLPGFSMPRMLKIDEGSDSDGENFEAVTPEHNPAPLEASRPVSLVGKRRHILEDVDGELEMEDVAPSHEAESASMNCEQHVHPPFAPPLPSGGSPFSPPLPVSPPPVPPPPPLLPLSSLALNPSNGGGELKLNTGGHVSIRPAGNALPQMDGPTLSNGKAYNLRPPQPTPSDQFSYVQADLARLSRRDAPPPSYSNRYHFEHNMDGANLYGDHDRTKLEYHESHDNWSFSGPSFHGPPYPPDKPAMSFSPVPCESGRVPNQGWHVPPPPLHRNKLLFRQAADEVPVASRAAHYWHPQ